ncbi:PGPGW domain-containing protein [Sphingomonas lenta]|uniref:PGPGW domain-containing protein n=1 Tax=Sphingomonas lenta TaxID=1141887 RepID=UPI00159545BB|nr:PGPGW domain-containing protein [Sphingomonas lenta]
MALFSRPTARTGQLTLGLFLMGASPLAVPLPGPGGIMVFSGGLVLTLRSSAKARRIFARQKRRYPRTGALLDRAMRRRSALRRIARAREAVQID